MNVKPDDTCPKCRVGALSKLKYVPYTAAANACDTDGLRCPEYDKYVSPDTEHLHVTCDRCGYTVASETQ